MSNPNPVLTSGLWHLNFARQYTLSLMEDFPADKAVWQPFPGANHFLWNLGHIAVTDAYFVSRLGAARADLPASWEKLFGMGSTPTPSAGDYPTVKEVSEAMSRAHEVLVAGFAALSDSRLAEPLSRELATFAPTFAHLPASIAWHEGVHAGQIVALRKAIGIKPRF